MPPDNEPAASMTEILTEQLRRNSEKLDRIKEAYRNGVDTLEEYTANKKIVLQERERLEDQLKEAESNRSNSESVETNLIERVRNVYDIVSSDSVDSATKNEILKSVIEKIIYDKASDELKVYYYYKPQSL